MNKCWRVRILMKKRLTAVLISMALMVGIIPTLVFADESQPEPAETSVVETTESKEKETEDSEPTESEEKETEETNASKPSEPAETEDKEPAESSSETSETEESKESDVVKGKIPDESENASKKAGTTVTISDNCEKNLSETGLQDGDTLELKNCSVTIVVDKDMTLDKITTSNSCDLTLKGDKTLTVSNGVFLGLTSSKFTLDGPTLKITGPCIAESELRGTGLRASETVIKSGKLEIEFNDPTNPHQKGIWSYLYTMTGGQVKIDISGKGSGDTVGIFCRSDDAVTHIKGGTLDITVKNEFGHPYGFYNSWDSGVYKVQIDGGTTNITANRPTDSGYARADGIAANSKLDFIMTSGTFNLDVINQGYDSIGITGDSFKVSGGTLNVTAETTLDGRSANGIVTGTESEILISGGKVTINSQSTSGGGAGIVYNNTDSGKQMEVTGGQIKISGSGYGIYVYNNSTNTVPKTLIHGDAVVTVASQNSFGIRGQNDGGWDICGEAELTSSSVEFVGFYIDGHLNIFETPTIKFTGKSTSAINKCAVYAKGGITIVDTLAIGTDDGAGKVSTEGVIAYVSTGYRAKEATITPLALTKVKVFCYNDVTNARITDGSVFVSKNSGTKIAAEEDGIVIKVAKGQDFTLTAGGISEGYTFSGWYYGGLGTQGGTLVSKNATVTLNINSDTWYYAEFAPTDKTEIKSLTFTADKMPMVGKTKEDCLPTVTVKEDGITVTGRSLLDMSGHHLETGHVFTEGEQVKLHVDYSVNRAYKLASDIKDHTTLNGIAPESHDLSDTTFVVVLTVQKEKQPNPLAVKGKTAKVKYKKLKKKNQTLSSSKVITFTKKGQGALTYSKVSGNKKITINKTTGKVTVKKKLKKGTYKVKVRVKAAGNTNYNPSGWKTVTFKIKVK